MPAELELLALISSQMDLPSSIHEERGASTCSTEDCVIGMPGTEMQRQGTTSEVSDD